ncbi:hypothetical protein GTY40_27620 [Streptomyces sp. SID8359]|uniref:hypothetical protein n=1 Tax=unclassified Streptomyces TaxID=2593676 RepID=UPI001371090C|nr:MULTISPECIES: hypothetical protein [unclassified Streptomyces]MYT94783.1 hypothetical protein [Streptomyces sp. SID8359]
MPFHVESMEAEGRRVARELEKASAKTLFRRVLAQLDDRHPSVFQQPGTRGPAACSPSRSRPYD